MSSSPAASPDDRPSRHTVARRVRALTTATVAAASVAVGALAVALSGTATAEGTSTVVVPATPSPSVGTDSTQLDPSVAPGATGSLQAPQQSPTRTSGRADAGTGGS